MTAADFLRFVIIVSLGVLAFITFLVAGTIVGLMWLDSWTCGTCARYPAGLYIMGLLGILLAASLGMEASEAPAIWGPWIKKNRDLLIIGGISFVAFVIVMNSRWWF
jgi:hypothetical protein